MNLENLETRMCNVSEVDLSLLGSVASVNQDCFQMTSKAKSGLVFDNKIFYYNSVKTDML